jgi:hypothetical protein
MFPPTTFEPVIDEPPLMRHHFPQHKSLVRANINHSNGTLLHLSWLQLKFQPDGFGA